MAKVEIPTLFVHWEEFLGWLLDRTEGFPKRMRFTLSNRIDNRAIDIFERIVEARYNRNRVPLLTAVNRDLETLRLLLRLANQRRAIDNKSFSHACAQIDVAGRMVGGWLRQQQASQS